MEMSESIVPEFMVKLISEDEDETKIIQTTASGTTLYALNEEMYVEGYSF